MIRQPEPVLSKVNTVDIISVAGLYPSSPGFRMISDMSMSTYSSASIAENICCATCVLSIHLTVSLLSVIRSKFIVGF